MPYVFNVILNFKEDQVYGCGGNGLIFRQNIITGHNEYFIG